jgi:hypothetical protein
VHGEGFGVGKTSRLPDRRHQRPDHADGLAAREAAIAEAAIAEAAIAEAAIA